MEFSFPGTRPGGASVEGEGSAETTLPIPPITAEHCGSWRCQSGNTVGLVRLRYKFNNKINSLEAF